MLHIVGRDFSKAEDIAIPLALQITPAFVGVEDHLVLVTVVSLEISSGAVILCPHQGILEIKVSFYHLGHRCISLPSGEHINMAIWLQLPPSDGQHLV